jgi:anthranilate synthase component 1
MSQQDFEAIVCKAKDYIRDGDIIQVVLAQQFQAQISSHPLNIYRALRYVNPSPYLYYLKLDDRRAIAGSSPEVMLRVTDCRAELRPIAGTRPRGATAVEDERLAADLLADPKERAEHVMLVDLARNDLGRVAETGSVTVEDYMFIERYSHVMHLVSQVEATVRPELDAIDVLKASFPAGTLSGAPKVRAMEIINELEPTSRGPYGGALGYIGYGGRLMDMAITIRTVAVEDDKATVTAGAGIVHDSVPETEFWETMHKSEGMKRALQLAEDGFSEAALAAASRGPDGAPGAVAGHAEGTAS